MLYSLVLKLKPENESLLSPSQGYYGYALFLHLVESIDRNLSSRLHDGDGPKPFTVSPLRGKFTRAGDQIRLSAKSLYEIRLTILDDTVFSAFLGSLLLKATSAELRLQNSVFNVVEVATTPDKSPWALCRQWHELLGQATPQRRISLRFLSPTAFRSGGKRNNLFPQPSLVFGSYLSRWNALNPVKLSLSVLGALDERVIPAQYRLETRILHFNNYQETGFEGVCNYLIDSGMPDEDVLALNVLADFAFFSGTGAKTTMGMGQTRRIDNARPLSGRTGLDTEKRRRYPGGGQGG